MSNDLILISDFNSNPVLYSILNLDSYQLAVLFYRSDFSSVPVTLAPPVPGHINPPIPDPLSWVNPNAC